MLRSATCSLPAGLPEDGAGEVLLLRGVPLAGQQHGEGVTGVGHEAGLVGHLAEHVGRVTVSSAGGLSAAHQGNGTGQSAQSSAAALRKRSKRKRAFRLPRIAPWPTRASPRASRQISLDTLSIDRWYCLIIAAIKRTTSGWAEARTTTAERRLERATGAAAKALLHRTVAILNVVYAKRAGVTV